MKTLPSLPLVVATRTVTLLSEPPQFFGLQWAMSSCLVVALMLGTTSVSRAADHAAVADHGAAAAPAASKAPAKTAAATASATETKDLGTDLKKALKDNLIDKKNLKLVITDKPSPKPVAAKTDGHGAPAAAPAVAHAAAPAAATHKAAAPAAIAVNPRASRDYIKAKAAALTGHESASDVHGGEVHWSYDGETGPQAWGQLKPEFNVCAIGKRQSPINIEDSGTLHGPAEPLMFNYTPSNGVVVNNGHTIQVDLQGENTLRVRGMVYKLVQFHFHSPSEEQVNYRNAAMVAHLVHKSNDGQLAVVAVLLDPGAANALINKVWTYMPLDANDRVRLPVDIVDMNELLPKDQRYFQFMGSLTTPPCTEGVLWMVLKQPTQISKDQIRLFQQLYPNNARPVQPINGRPVRNAQ
jgi:carbonic anhydrase